MTITKMNAIVCTQYGAPDVLQLQQVEKPIPKDNEVLIKIHAAAVTAADGFMRKGTPFFARFFIGLFKPKNPIPGTGFAGTVESMGKAVKTFSVGDQVFGETTLGFGANAEYVCVDAAGVIAHKPQNISYAAAATICDGPMTSLNFLKELANIQAGQTVLVNGASGSLGTAAVQLAKYFGAEVTGVCSRNNLELVQSLGADHVIDYTTTDFTQQNKHYDIIYDTVGKLSFSSCKKSLTTNGLYLSPVLSFSLLLNVMKTAIFGSKKAKFSATGALPTPALRILLQQVTELIQTEKIKSIIDKSYPLAQTAAAHQYVDKGHKKGNVVVVPEH
ncbi:NAD(P)-dependent alcohol dehydrogenase [Aureispira anguillae]|uniref:NAD(P)-dependent alcohol dehydrogenase n=1 Tax=Aureispira anguillae TaxID=2864201 RepID=A0A916DWC3_9BACT|nr:NAD(P)-dependent alcohol dehydrogenase [Aureispira anguillae]BDS15321.1 NAD(P)-dependent alcohol dehydrogenase [Aureispira anguillae]